MATFATDDWYALSRPIHCRLCSREHDPYLHVWSSLERVRVRWASELLSELSDRRLLLSDGKGTISSMLSLTVRVKQWMMMIVIVYYSTYFLADSTSFILLVSQFSIFCCWLFLKNLKKHNHIQEIILSLSLTYKLFSLSFLKT